MKLSILSDIREKLENFGVEISDLYLLKGEISDEFAQMPSLWEDFFFRMEP